MPLLYYWRGDNYRRDLDEGAGFNLNQASATMHDVAIGESLWAFTSRRDGIYVLAAELVVKAKTMNPPGYRYGAYRVWGDLKLSRYFAIDDQSPVDGVIRALSVSTTGQVLGRAFQGRAAVRRITKQDDAVLRANARDLPLEPRATQLHELQLETALLSNDSKAVESIVKTSSAGIAEHRRKYLATEAFERDRKLVAELQAMYEGRCQICLWSPRTVYSADICQGHHLHWLSRGGVDDLRNMALVCPNHHAAIHRLDAVFDFC